MYTDRCAHNVRGKGEVQVEEMEGSRKPSSLFLFIEQLGNQGKSTCACMHGCMFVCVCVPTRRLFILKAVSLGTIRHVPVTLVSLIGDMH